MRPRWASAIPNILPTTVCAVVEHGGELLMVRQLNRDGEERWNFPTGWMEPVDEDGRVQLPEHSVNRNLLVETGYAASDAHLVGISLVREHDPDGHRVGTSLRLNYVCEQLRADQLRCQRPGHPGRTGVVHAGADRRPDRTDAGQGGAHGGGIPPLADLPGGWGNVC